MSSLWTELKRRNVFRVAAGYLILAWLILQIADVILGNIGAPGWVFQVILLLLALGLPMALFFAWVFELTPEGLKKEKDVDRNQSITRATGRKLDFAIIFLLAVSVAYLAVDKFVFAPDQQGNVALDESVTSSGVTGPEATSIAVLPFVNMSSDPENEYFADGISEEILNLLANIPGLQVTSRSSAFSFKGQNLDVPTMAARLNVAHVLEGSVRKAGKQLRITAQLIRVATDTHLWSETYDRELENVFQIQDEIAATVASAMEVTLLGEQPRVAETDPEAYALYLQAQQYVRQSTPEGARQAESLVKQSLDIDPRYVPARTLLGTIYSYQTGIFGFHSYAEGMELARAEFKQALDLDPAYASAHSGLGNIAMNYDFDFASAARHFERALSLAPGNDGIIRSAARLEMVMGRRDDAVALYRQALTLDPLHGHASLGVALYIAGHYEEAARMVSTAISLNPAGHRDRYVLARILLAQGELDKALEMIEAEPSEIYKVVGLALIQHARGDKVAADAALNTMLEKNANDGPYQIAEAYAYRGEVDQAFEWLQRAYDIRDLGIISLKNDPVLSGLRNDPRWDEMLEKVGLPD